MRTMLAPLLALLLFVSCNARPPGAVDVEQTVAHVQNILQRNPDLPRLDRRQILALLHDIRAEDALSNATIQETKTPETVPTVDDAENEIPKEIDNLSVQALSTEEPRLVLITQKPNKFKQFHVKNSMFSHREANGDEPRVMVVLPFTPSEGTDLGELYTRPPLTAVVSASSLPSSGNLKHVNVIPLNTTPSTSAKKSSTTLVDDLNPISVKNPAKTSHKKNHRDTTSEKDSKASRIQANVENETKPIKVEHKVKSNTPNPAGIQNTKHEYISAHYTDLSAALNEFLEMNGFDKSPVVISPDSPYSDFKPLPTPQIVTGGHNAVPEDLLLTYDLLTKSESLAKPDSYDDFYGHYDAIKTGLPELDSLASEPKPNFAITVGKNFMQKENDADIVAAASSDSFKVVPLPNGPSPILALSEFNINESNELFKRQNLDSETESSADLTTEKPDGSTEKSNSSPDSDTDVQTTLDSESNSDSTALAAESPSISDLESSFGATPVLDPSESELPPPRRNGFYFTVDWNSFLEVGDGDNKVNIRFEPKLGDPQMFLPVTVP